MPQISMSPMSFSIAPSPAGGTVYLCPLGEVMQLEMKRNGSRVAYSAGLSMIPEVGTSSTAILKSDGFSLVSANDDGEVVTIDTRTLKPSWKTSGELSEKIGPR